MGSGRSVQGRNCSTGRLRATLQFSLSPALLRRTLVPISPPQAGNGFALSSAVGLLHSAEREHCSTSPVAGLGRAIAQVAAAGRCRNDPGSPAADRPVGPFGNEGEIACPDLEAPLARASARLAANCLPPR